MAISGQQNINIGLPNESIGSDSLFTAFTKIDENFTTVFDNASPYNTFTGGAGISTSANSNTGTVTITNTGVTNIIAGTNIVVSQANGNVTISSTGGGNGNGGGTLSSVGLIPNSTSRLVVYDSPLVTNGNLGIDLATSGVTAGSYINPNITVDTYGRVTTIANGAVAGTVTSIGLTAGPGVQVNGGPITSNGNIIVTNTGVIKLTAGSGIDLSGSNGNVTVSLSGGINGTVTSVGISSTSLVVAGGPITTSGTITINLPTNPTISGNLTTGNLTTGNADLGTLATAQYFSGDGSNLTNLVAANIVGTVSSATTAGTVTTAAQPNITSVGTLTSLAVVASANPSLGNNVTANFFTGSGQNLSNIQGANVSGTVANASNATRVSTTLIATGTYYIPFISATASGNYSLNSNAAFSANLANGTLIATTFVGNLTGNVTGNISGNIVAAGSNTQVLFNDAGNVNASSGMTFNKSTNQLTITGNISGANISVTSYNIRSITTGISANGSTQGTATALTKEINVVSTVTSGQGVVLPTAVAGMVLIVNNTSANTLVVYPASGGTINSDASYSHPAGASLQYYATSSTQWYTVGASYA